jgi:F0F1-type ATP synthase membrane subunit c/vacuolar-type H+-ATPase subunit K
VKNGSGMSPSLWIAIGIAIGAGIGVAMDNLAIGIAIGVAIGAALMAMETSRQKKNDDSVVLGQKRQ